MKISLQRGLRVECHQCPVAHTVDGGWNLFECAREAECRVHIYKPEDK